MRIFIFGLAAAGLTLSGGQSAASNEPAAEAHKPHVKQWAGYMKPGAAVSLSHDYDGSTALGEFENLTARLTHIYQHGSLSAGLLASPDLQISAFTPLKNIPVLQGGVLDLPIQFSGTEQGYFTLSLEVVYKDPDGHESRRVLSIPVNMGAASFEKTSAAGKTEIKTISKPGLIGLPAMEVIE